jgi:signal transduction histidine kinase
MDKRSGLFKKLFFMRSAAQRSQKEAADESRSRSAVEEDLNQKNKLLQIQNDKLNDIAWVVSHKVRGPVASILGLAKLFNHNDLADPDNAKILEGIYSAANELDTAVKEVVVKAGKKTE